MRWVLVETPDGGNPKCRLLVKYMDDKQFFTDIWVCFAVGDSVGCY